MDNSTRKNKVWSACLSIIAFGVVCVCVFVVPDIYESWLRDQRDEYIDSGAFRKAQVIAKKASLETFGVTRIQDEEINEFIFARIAQCFVWPEAPVAGSTIDTIGGVATAVSPDGYFLTAAHNLLDEAGNRKDLLWLIGLTTANPYVAKADVVWVAEEHDMALIHARIKQVKWFTVADASPEIGDTVIAGGWVSGQGVGKLVSLYERSSQTPPRILLSHNAPLLRGDSGGPLVDMNGHLVGINFFVTYTPLSIFRKTRQKWAHANSATEDWLQRLIQDHRNQMNSEEQQAPD